MNDLRIQTYISCHMVMVPRVLALWLDFFKFSLVDVRSRPGWCTNFLIYTGTTPYNLMPSFVPVKPSQYEFLLLLACDTVPPSPFLCISQQQSDLHLLTSL